MHTHVCVYMYVCVYVYIHMHATTVNVCMYYMYYLDICDLYSNTNGFLHHPGTFSHDGDISSVENAYTGL